VVGPLSSFILGFIFAGLEALSSNTGWPEHYSGIFGYLALINWVVAGFNLIPAFPLDGGRILRSAIWKWKGNLRSATRWASNAGNVFGIALIVLGVISILTGNVVGGVWYVIIGMFLRGSAQMSYKQLVMKQTLKGDPVKKHMSPDPVTVSPDLSLSELVEDYFYKYHFKMFPVVEDGRLRGCVHTKQLKQTDRNEWGDMKVADLAGECSDENTVGPDTDVMDALSHMRRTDNSRMLVVDSNGRLVGVVALKDLMRYLSLRMDIEGGD
jgi:CBS domain-containing protein